MSPTVTDLFPPLPDRGDWHDETVLVRAGVNRTPFAETCEPVFMTSGFVYGSAEEAAAAFDGSRPRYIYARYNNPTVAAFEGRLAALEWLANWCKGTSSGMAAVWTTMAALTRAGSRVVAARALFGSCHWIISELLPRFGVVTEMVDAPDIALWEQALSRPADVVFLESPSNPTLQMFDLTRICELAHKAGALVVLDNVLATPLLQQPMDYGVDIVTYSATKHIDGQGRCLGGAILAQDADLAEARISPVLRHTGPALSPMNAWLLLKGLETLPLRVDRQCAGAQALAERLVRHGAVTRVHYPGLPDDPGHELMHMQMRGKGGTVLAFEVAGGQPAAFRVLNALELIDISNNLGDAKSMVTHPATTTHQRLPADEKALVGITPGLVRLSVGLEHVDDLWADLARALDRA